MRKIVSQQIPYYNTLRSLDPENREVLLTSCFLAVISGLTRDKYDGMVADDMDNRRSYDAPMAPDSDIHQRLELLISRSPLYPEQ